MEPTPYAHTRERYFQNVLGVDRMATIRNNKCTHCGGDAYWFKDQLSKTEYTISGMCQKCQDDIWGRLAELDDEYNE